MAAILQELKRRKVFKVAAVYAVVAWLLIQIVATVEEPLNLPPWFDTLVIVLLGVGFPVAVILAWSFDITPEGVRSADGELLRRGDPLGGQRLSVVLQGLVLIAVIFLLAQQYLFEPRVRGIATAPLGTLVNRFSDEFPEGHVLRRGGRAALAISPDGRRFAYNSFQGIYVRSLDQLESKLIPGTEPDLTSITFSPDGRSLAYWDPATLELKRVSIDGGTSIPIAGVPENPRGVSWEADNTLLFGQPDGIHRVVANGGTPQRIISADADTVVYAPRLLPDGDTVLYSLAPEPARNGDWSVVTQSLSTGERSVIIEHGFNARYLPTGHLIYASGSGLFGVTFDLERLAVLGAAVSLVQNVPSGGFPTSAASQYGIADDGTLIYVTGGVVSGNAILWVDREGQEERLAIERSGYLHLRISPDGTRVLLVSRTPSEGLRTWIWDFERETRTILNIEASGVFGNFFPLWTPDSSRIVYANAKGELWVTSASNAAGSELLASGVAPPGEIVMPMFFTPSGTQLVFRTPRTTDRPNNIGMIRLDGESEPSWLLQGPYSQDLPTLSPDGRWMAYQSDESGVYEIYVRPFPNVNDNRVQVSNAGGIWPKWSPGGRELFYGEPGRPGQLIAVTVEPDNATFSYSDRKPLFEWNYQNLYVWTYDVPLNGDRFLVLDENDPERIIIVQNWFEEVKNKLPRGD